MPLSNAEGSDDATSETQVSSYKGENQKKLKKPTCNNERNLNFQ